MTQLDVLDTDRLTPYLEAHVAGFQGPISATKFSGGQSNPTFHVKAGSGDYVLRRQPPGKLLKSAHAVDREYRVMRALADTDVPVPEVYHLCEDRAVIGSLFFLMALCNGRIFWNAAIPEVDPVQRSAMYAEMNRVLSGLHAVDPKAVGLGDYGRPGNYFERQVGRWSKQYRASETEHIQALEDVMVWLADNMPEDDGQVTLVHGDYRLDNLVWHPDEPRVIAVLDWELSTLGHPLADLAYQCMQLRMSPQGETLSGLAGLDRHELGIPSEQEYVAAYCERRGIAQIEHWEFYLVFSFFRFAAIIQGVYKRARDGNASSSEATRLGRMVAPLATQAMQIIRDGA
ncbi:MAG TPA: phosphotransferase [Salinisphaeraceae bacterium]|nr:phosphotransferase [Salinisphaeraceae bacterium]